MIMPAKQLHVTQTLAFVPYLLPSSPSSIATSCYIRYSAQRSQTEWHLTVGSTAMESLTRTSLQPITGAAAAGVDKKDIKLSVDGDVLSLSVQKDESKEVWRASARIHMYAPRSSDQLCGRV